MEKAGVKIGLEIHCQLTNLKTKLFCGCPSDYRGKEPNTTVCPVCLGIPGTLPRPNQKAVEDAVMVAVALSSHISEETVFYRKNYYYPDMSKNFQISQYDGGGGVPVATSGMISVEEDGIKIKVRVRRLQLEEDPAKLVHLGAIDTSPYTLVDYNRAGIALLEIVTEPDLTSPREARLLLQKLRSILEHLGVSDGSLEGAMRCDANISLAGGARTEVKNISSFKEVERALNFEVMRQRSLMARGLKAGQETRHWDETRRTTITLRTKEEEQDYRYFPEPDLTPMRIPGEMIESIRWRMPELPDARKDRFVKQYHLPPMSASVLTSEKALADFFEKCAHLYPNARQICNWITTDLLRCLHGQNLEIGESKITPANLVEMLRMIDEGVISGKIGKKILPEMVKTGSSPREVAHRHGLVRISEHEVLEKVVKSVFDEFPSAVKDALTDEKAVHYLVGQVMKRTEGRADPQLANKLIRERLRSKTPQVS